MYTNRSTQTSIKRTFEIFHDPIESDLPPSVAGSVPPNLKETQLNKTYLDNKENWDAVNKNFANRKPRKPLKKKKATKDDVELPVQILTDVTEAYTLDARNGYIEVSTGLLQETPTQTTRQSIRIYEKEHECTSFSRSSSIINKTELRTPQQSEERSEFHVDHSVAEKVFAADKKAFLVAQKHIIEAKNSTVTESKDNITNETQKNSDIESGVSHALVLTKNHSNVDETSTRSKRNNTKSKIPISKGMTQKPLSVAITKSFEKPLDVEVQPLKAIKSQSQKDIDMGSTKQMKK